MPASAAIIGRASGRSGVQLWASTVEAGRSVSLLTQDVCVAGVPCRLLDHVYEDPAQRDLAKRLFAEAGTAFDDELQRRLGSAVPERTLRQFAATLARLRAAGHRAEMEQTA